MTETTSTLATIFATKTTATTAEPSRANRNQAIKITAEKSKQTNDGSNEAGMLCDCFLQFLCGCV